MIRHASAGTPATSTRRSWTAETTRDPVDHARRDVVAVIESVLAARSTSSCSRPGKVPPLPIVNRCCACPAPEGASGAAGEVAVQLAVGPGATVIGTASEVDQERAPTFTTT
jgi:hypothetical protein